MAAPETQVDPPSMRLIQTQLNRREKKKGEKRQTNESQEEKVKEREREGKWVYGKFQKPLTEANNATMQLRLGNHAGTK